MTIFYVSKHYAKNSVANMGFAAEIGCSREICNLHTKLCVVVTQKNVFKVDVKNIKGQ